MKIRVLSKELFDAEMRSRGLNDSNVEATNKLYIISVSQSETDTSVYKTVNPALAPYFAQDHRNVIRMFFDDVKWEGPIWTPTGMVQTKMFTQDDGNKIIDFADRIEPDSEIVIHCLMGKSRSAAIAQWLSEKFGVVDIDYHREDITPNERVLVYLRELHKEKLKPPLNQTKLK